MPGSRRRARLLTSCLRLWPDAVAQEERHEEGIGVVLDGPDKVGTAHRDGNPVPTSFVAGPAVLKRQTGAICNRVTTPVVRVRIPAAGPKTSTRRDQVDNNTLRQTKGMTNKRVLDYPGYSVSLVGIEPKPSSRHSGAARISVFFCSSSTPSGDQLYSLGLSQKQDVERPTKANTEILASPE